MRCKEDGLPCGTKLWGPKTQSGLLHEEANDARSGQMVLFLGRPVPESDDEFITPLDDLYLRYFLKGRSQHLHIVVQIGNEAIAGEIVPGDRVALMLSSKPLRCAALAYASFHKAQQLNLHTLQYLDRCFKCMREALSNSVAVDLVYACYLLSKVVDDNAVEMTYSHLLGLSKIMKCIKSGPNKVEEWEWGWMEGLWLEGLVNLYCRLQRLSLQSPQYTATKVRQVCNMLLGYQLHGVVNTALYLVYLETVLFYHSTYYLLLINHVFDDESVVEATQTRAAANELSSLIEGLTEFLPYFSKRFTGDIQKLWDPIDVEHEFIPKSRQISDFGCLSIFFSTKLFSLRVASKDLAPENSVEMLLARSLCRLSVLIDHSPQVGILNEIKILFLAGLSLTQARQLEGYFPLL